METKKTPHRARKNKVVRARREYHAYRSRSKSKKKKIAEKDTNTRVKRVLKLGYRF